MAGAPKFVDSKIKQRKVLLFAKKSDPACIRAREILDTFKMTPQNYEVVEIDKRQDCTQIENHFLVICLASSRTVPRLFIDGKYVGGEPEISRLYQCGALAARLGVAGTLDASIAMESLPCLDNTQSVLSMAPCVPVVDQRAPCLDNTQSVISMIGPCT